MTLQEMDMILHSFTIAQKPLKDHMKAVGHKEVFDEYRVKHNLRVMEKLFARDVAERMDGYFAMLKD